MVLEGEGKLDAEGKLSVEFNVPKADEKELWDYTYRLEAQVTDAARRTMEGGTSFTGIRSNTVAYAQPERYVYYQGDTARIAVTANDREGRPVQTRVRLTFFERRWEKVMKKSEYGDEYADYERKDKELSSASVETDAQGRAALDYVVPISGSIQIKTTVEEQGRPVVAEAGYLWVTDRAGEFADVSYEEEGVIKLVPDKKSYRPGETAKVLALLPTDKAHLLVTTELATVLDVRRVDAPGRAVIIDVPIEARYAPNVFLSVTYVRGSEMYSEDLMLVVPARDKLLKLELIPNKKEFRPRETASYTVLARNADGSPAPGAEVSLGVVDESIYSIASENVGDIRRDFYGRRYKSVQTSFSVNYYFTGYAGKKALNLAAHKKARHTRRPQTSRDGHPQVRKFQGHGLLAARARDGAGREGHGEVRAAGQSDDVARDGARGDRRHTRRRRRLEGRRAQGRNHPRRAPALPHGGRHGDALRHRSTTTSRPRRRRASPSRSVARAS